MQRTVTPTRKPSPATRLVTVRLGAPRAAQPRIISLTGREPVRIKLAA